MTLTPAPARHIDAFHALLETRGTQAALVWLNAGVPHRYSAIYCLKNDLFVPTFVHDKLGERIPPLLRLVPFEASFCQIVLRDGQLMTNDSTADSRLDASPYQGVVISYHGVAIADDAGRLHGSLCHFDMTGQALTDSEYTLLQGAAKLMHRYLSPIRKRRARPTAAHRLVAVPPIASPYADGPAIASGTFLLPGQIDLSDLATLARP